jgi:hypothetical protein
MLLRMMFICYKSGFVTAGQLFRMWMNIFSGYLVAQVIKKVELVWGHFYSKKLKTLSLHKKNKNYNIIIIIINFFFFK